MRMSETHLWRNWEYNKFRGISSALPSPFTLYTLHRLKAFTKNERNVCSFTVFLFLTFKLPAVCCFIPSTALKSSPMSSSGEIYLYYKYTNIYTKVTKWLPYTCSMLFTWSQKTFHNHILTYLWSPAQDKKAHCAIELGFTNYKFVPLFLGKCRDAPVDRP